MNIYVIVPNWNGADFLQQCIDSLLSQTIKCTIVVVENGSIDKSDDILAAYEEKVVTLKQAKNLGFAGGVNVGIRYALQHAADYVLLFNNDAEADKHLVENLASVMEANKKVGIVTSKIKRKDNSLDSTGDFYSSRGLPFPRGRGQDDTAQFDKDSVVFGASGGSSLYRAKMLKEIGLFDEDFFAYYEDVDVSFRAQLAGWTIRFESTGITWHAISATSSRIPGFTVYHTAKNFPLLFIKNLPLKLALKYFIPATYTYLRMWAAKIIKGGFWPFTKGFFKFVILIPAALRKRFEIQKTKKVDTNYIESMIYKGNPKDAFRKKDYSS